MVTERPNIDNDDRDQALVFARMGVSLLPVVGGMVSEIITAMVHQQRTDRIAVFMRQLEGELTLLKLDHQVLADKVQQREFVDLFQDGLFQAARSLSDERLAHLATVLKNSITDEELSHIDYKRILNLLDQVNDAELIVLKFYDLIEGPDEMMFTETHRAIIKPIYVTRQSPQIEKDRAALHRLYEINLQRLGLIRASYEIPRSGQEPKFDRYTGMLQIDQIDITDLGRLLLRKVAPISFGESTNE